MSRLDGNVDPLAPALTEAKRMGTQRTHLPAAVDEPQPFGRQLGPEIGIRRDGSPTQRRTRTGVFDHEPPRFVDLLKRVADHGWSMPEPPGCSANGI